jgi:oligosaccharide repeat unit polymerase
VATGVTAVRAPQALELLAAVGGGVTVAWAVGRWVDDRVLLFVLAVVTAGVMMQSMCRVLDIRRITIPGFWFLTYLALVGLPALAASYAFPPALAHTVLGAILATLFTVPLGMKLANVATRFRHEEIARFYKRPVVPTGDTPRVTAAFLILLGIACCFATGYLVEAPALPLVSLVTGDASGSELLLLREDAFKLLQSPFQYAYTVVRAVLFPILVAVSLAQALATRRRLWYLLAGVTSIIGLSYASLAIAKAPPAIILLVGFLLVYVYRAGRLPVTAVLGAAAVVLAFPVFVILGLSRGTGTDVWVVLAALFRRLFILPGEILHVYFEIFPAHHPYLHGASVGRLAWVQGVAPFDLGNYVFLYMYPDGMITGGAPAAFPGPLNADFGPLGVVLGGIIAGFLMQVAQVYLCRRVKSPVTVGVFAYMVFAFAQVNLTALTTVLLSGGVVFGLGILLANDALEALLGVDIRTLSPTSPA